MPRTGLSKEEIVEKAAELANEKGLSYLSVTTLSEYLGIRKNNENRKWEENPEVCFCADDVLVLPFMYG